MPSSPDINRDQAAVSDGSAADPRIEIGYVVQDGKRIRTVVDASRLFGADA